MPEDQIQQELLTSTMHSDSCTMPEELDDCLPSGYNARPTVDGAITKAIEPFSSIQEIAEIRVRRLEDALLFYVFADMPTYSRTLLRRLVEAEYMALGSAPDSLSLQFEFYPLPMAVTAREPFRGAVCYKRQ